MKRFCTFTVNMFCDPASRYREDIPRTWLREVEVPEVFLKEVEFIDHHTKTPRAGFREKLLELIFGFGQNEVQERVAPSLSMGDLIVLDGTNGLQVFRAQFTGFIRVHDVTRLDLEEQLAIIASQHDPEAVKVAQAASAERHLRRNDNKQAADKVREDYGRTW